MAQRRGSFIQRWARDHSGKIYHASWFGAWLHARRINNGSVYLCRWGYSPAEGENGRRHYHVTTHRKTAFDAFVQPPRRGGRYPFGHSRGE